MKSSKIIQQMILLSAAIALFCIPSPAASDDSNAHNKSADSPAPPSAPQGEEPPTTIQMGPMFDGRAINAGLDVGFIAWNNVNPPSRFFSRIRIGMLRTRDPLFATTDLGIDIGGLRPVSVGFHFGVTHWSAGFCAQAFYALALDKTSIIGASLGWSIFGVEFHTAPGEDFDRIWLFKLRIPFGTIMYGAYRMDRDVKKLSQHRSEHH